MGWREDFENFALNMITFGGYGAGQLIRHAMSESEQGVAAATSVGVQAGGYHPREPITPPAPSRPRGARPTAGSDGSEDCPSCCDRFRLNDGYLVDGATGTVWRLDAKSGVLAEIPRTGPRSSDDLKQTVLEMEIEKIRNKYQAEVLNELAVSQRAKQLAAFEKRYLQPLRKAVLASKGR